MIARLLGLLLILCIGQSVPVQAETVPVGPERQILVMLRLAPPHFRTGAGYAGGYGEDQSRGARLRIASAIARRHHLSLAGNWPMPAIGVDCFIMTVPAGQGTDSAADAVSHDQAVEWAQPVALFQALGADRADPLFAAQPVAKAWHLARLHRVATGRRIKIAVIDSQIDATHPDLVGQIAQARDFVVGRPSVAEDHGTGIAGVIAAKASDGIGIAGVAPGARLYALRACWQPVRSPTMCDTLRLAKAINYAVEQRTEIINLSLSGPSDRLLAALLNVGMKRGTDIVAAFDTRIVGGGFPASLSGVVAVAAVPVKGAHAPYWAPGQDIPTTQPGGRWNLVSGASYAAAEVSGLLALRRERNGAGNGSRALVSARAGGGEIDGCATLLGNVPDCNRTGDVAAVVPHRPR